MVNTDMLTIMLAATCTWLMCVITLKRHVYSVATLGTAGGTAPTPKLRRRLYAHADKVGDPCMTH
jgi:hypothetical protein